VDGEFFESEPQLMIRLAVRASTRGALLFQDRLELEEAELDNLIPQLAREHLDILSAHPVHMIEIEFLDEPDPLKRYFRFGTDPSHMVRPTRVNLPEENIN
jgi:hypothetical protein